MAGTRECASCLENNCCVLRRRAAMLSCTVVFTKITLTQDEIQTAQDPVFLSLIFREPEQLEIKFGYSTESNQKLMECMHKDAAVRAIAFGLDGRKLVVAYSEQTLKFYDVEAGFKLERTIKNATT
ncbi:unnamed protein product [Orchesella dallaii]|uniref:Uncharacterized protein n=1 Tax=Orchesella dallaii TaxID=48710 RepID=A0ABP1S546_9HEXA